MLVYQHTIMVKKKKAELSTSSSPTHQGKLLRKLYLWSDLTIENFTATFNRSRQWANNAFKWEVIPLREKIAIAKAFKIDVEYFDGTIKLPMDKPSAESEVNSQYESLKKQ